MANKVAQELLQKHPLQRLESPSRGASALLHIFGLATFAYAFSYLVLNPNQINESYGWHFQYLTIIGLALSTLTFSFGLLADITLSRRLFAVKNALSVASAPIECLISILYWGLRAIDTSLVLPPWAPILLLRDDFSFHLIPALSLVLDLLFFSPPYTIAVLPALGLSACIAFGYWFWIEQCYAYNQFYPYPIFDVLSTPGRVGLFAASAGLMAAATGALVWLYGVVNGREVRGARSGNVKGE
ncbi:hypothetical protein MBLNU13_g04683t1 [Cladosporium sp. NU13]